MHQEPLKGAPLVHWRRACQKSKGALFFSPGHTAALVGRLRARALSPLLAMGLMDTLRCLLCPPLSDTTDDDAFFDGLRQVPLPIL